MPNEILLCIAEELELHEEINNFQRVNHHLYSLLNTHLYKFNLQQDDGSALLYAARHKQPEAARKLLAQTTDKTHRLRYRLKVALQIAAEVGQGEIVSLLLDHGVASNVEHWMESGNMRNTLEIAAFFGHEQVANLLLDRGSDVNLPSIYDRWMRKGTYERTSLYAASIQGHTRMVKLMLDHGAKVNMQVGLNGNALQAAAECGHEDIVRFLLDHGAEVNAPGQQYHFPEDQFTDSNALRIAFEKGHHAIVKLLLEHGADFNVQTAPRRSVRLAALASGYKESVISP